MNKKIFTGLLLLLLASTLIMSGGCDNSNNSFSDSNTGNDVNSKLNGAWKADTGTISVVSAGTDSTAAKGPDLPSDVLEQLKAQSPDLYEMYTQAKEDEAAETEGTTINASIATIIAVFENSNVSEDTGTAKLTSVILVSADNAQVPILLNGVTLNTTRQEQGKWTAEIPDVGSLNIVMNSDNSMNFSGTLEYLNYTWEFDTVINKVENDNLASVNPSEVLEGVWKFDKTCTGGYLATDSNMAAALNPEDASVAFSTNEQGMTTIASSYYMSLNSAISALDYDDTEGSGSELKDIIITSGTLTDISSNVCKFKAEDGSECLIFIEGSDRIFAFSSSTDNGNTYIFLPLTRLEDFDSTLPSLMAKTWTGSTGNGGGYMHLSKAASEDPDDVLTFLIMSRMSFFLESCTMSFADTKINNDDNTVNATINLESLFNVTSEYLKELGSETFSEPITMNFTTNQASFTRTGNILKYHMAEEDGDEDTLYISFMSENKALIVSHSTSEIYEGEMRVVAVLDAN